MVDHYRPEVEKLEDRLDELEKRDLRAARPDAGPPDPRREARRRRRCAGSSRRSATSIARLARREFVDISTEMSFRFRDIYDHLVRIADDAMIFQDRITGMLDAHLSNVSNRLNEVMKVLTVVVDDLRAADAAGRHLRHERPAAAVSGRRGRAVLVAVRHHGRHDRRRCSSLFRRKRWI